MREEGAGRGGGSENEAGRSPEPGADAGPRRTRLEEREGAVFLAKESDPQEPKQNKTERRERLPSRASRVRGLRRGGARAAEQIVSPAPGTCGARGGPTSAA